jgi:hypothetical protein
MKKYLSNDFDLNEFVNVFDECPIWSAPFGLKLLDLKSPSQKQVGPDIPHKHLSPYLFFWRSHLSILLRNSVFCF